MPASSDRPGRGAPPRARAGTASRGSSARRQYTSQTSAWASRSTRPSGPWTAACARSSPRTTRWSPPRQSVRAPERTIGSRRSAICPTVRSALPGVTATSPRSATDSATEDLRVLHRVVRPQGDRRRSESPRGRTALRAGSSSPCRTGSRARRRRLLRDSSTSGQRANVLTPVYRGETKRVGRPVAGSVLSRHAATVPAQ